MKEFIENPFIEVGEGSYYSGYYGNQNFEDGCIRYLWGDEKTKGLFNPIKDFGWTTDEIKHAEPILMSQSIDTLYAYYQKNILY